MRHLQTLGCSIYIKNEVIYFDSFGVEYIPEEIKKSIGNKNNKTNLFRIQDYNSVMCGYFCILFMEFMVKNKTLTDFTNLFSLWDLKKTMKEFPDISDKTKTVQCTRKDAPKEALNLSFLVHLF